MGNIFYNNLVLSAVIAILVSSSLGCHGQRNTNNNRGNNNEAILFPTEDLYNNVQGTIFGRNTPESIGNQRIPTSQQATPTNTAANNEFVTDFAWNIFKGSRTANPIGNLVLSPLLLQITLSLLQKAAYGQTFEQIGQVINYAHPYKLNQLVNSIKTAPSRNEIGLASAIFADKEIMLNQSFATESKLRDVGLIAVDFGRPTDTGYIINNWISNATNNNIRNIFKAENSRGIRMLLANALYFRGFWRQVFNTSERNIFYTSDKLHKSVMFMKKVELLRANVMELTSGAKGAWVEIPYEGNEFSMLIIVPSDRYSLDAFIRQMSSRDLVDIIDQLDSSYKKLVHLNMPKFSIQSSFSLVNVLLKLGLVDIFTINSQLPFLTVNHENLKVDDILQEAILKVDETGSVASVVQSVSVVTLSINDSPEEIVFHVDQPFLSVIVDKRNCVPLFVSKIFDP